jgi:hypothetical protein
MAQKIIAVQDMELPTSVTAISTSSVALLGEKTTSPRKVLVITNVSTLNQVITLGIGTPAVALKGIVLYAGQSYIESPSDGFRPTNVAIYAISSAAGGAVSVYERAAPTVGAS